MIAGTWIEVFNAHMTWQPKTFAILAVTALVLVVLLAVANHTLNADQKNYYVIGLAAFLFLVFVYSLIPLFIALFVYLQGSVGNADLGPITWLRGHQKGVAIGFWTIFTLGMLIASPVMMRDMLGIGPLAPSGPGESQGRLVANIGMTLDEVRKRSTPQLPPARHQKLTGSSKIIGNATFEFEIADTGTHFGDCRYYWIETGNKGDQHVRNINVGISSRSATLAEIAEADKQVQAGLTEAGWAPGQFYYRTEEEQALHSGQKSSGYGWYWRKGNTILHLMHSRMDEPKTGEDSATAGLWIQYVDLWPRDDKIFKDLEFAGSSLLMP